MLEYRLKIGHSYLHIKAKRVNYDPTVQHNIPENLNLEQQHCENPKLTYTFFYNAHVFLPFNTTEPFGVICFMEFVYYPMLKIRMHNIGNWIVSCSQAKKIKTYSVRLSITSGI